MSFCLGLDLLLATRHLVQPQDTIRHNFLASLALFYNMKAQKPPSYDADTVADLEQVANTHLDGRNQIKA